MASGFPVPLQVLSGLAGETAKAGTGLFEGQAEGIERSAALRDRDLQSRLRVLDAILKGKQIQQADIPQESIHGGNIYRFDPRTGRMMFVGPAAPAPLNPLQQADLEAKQREAQEGQIRLGIINKIQSGQSLTPFEQSYARAAGLLEKARSPVHVAPGGALVDPQTGQSVFERPQKPERPVSVAPGGTLIDPTTGKSIYHAPFKPSTALTPRETVEESFQPVKPGTDDFKALNDSLPRVLQNDFPGFQPPTGTIVTLKSGKRVKIGRAHV